MDVLKLSDDYAVAAQILASDVEPIAAAGFVAIICNRPDDEDPGQPSAAEIRAACDAAGIAFHHVPITGGYLSPEAVLLQRSILDDSDGPVLAYCRSGQRCSMVYDAGRS